jgi:hypothetical protein
MAALFSAKIIGATIFKAQGLGTFSSPEMDKSLS